MPKLKDIGVMDYKIEEVKISRFGANDWMAWVKYQLILDTGDVINKNTQVDIPQGFINAVTARVKQVENL